MRDVKGYEGLYAVTSCGKVWSYKSDRFLSPCKTKSGYMFVRLCKKWKSEKYVCTQISGTNIYRK